MEIKLDSLLAANVSLREKLGEKEENITNMLEELNSIKTVLGRKSDEIEGLERELSQERVAHEQTRQLWKSAEKELIEIDDAFKRCGNPVGAHDTRPEKIVNVLGANKCMAELLKERENKPQINTD